MNAERLTGAQTLFEPDTLDALADLVAEAALTREPFEIIGGGALRAYGRLTTATRTLSTRRLNQIHFYEPDELVISLAAGADLDQVTRILDEAGQQLAFEPPDYSALLGSSAPRTIGGVIAANLSGPRRPMAGAARDHLLGFVAVNGRGEVVKSGGRVVKNVTGYDLSKLIAGSWGTLAVLATANLKVLPKPEAAVSLVVSGLDARAAVDLFGRVLAAPLGITGAAWLPADLAAPWASGPIAALRLEGFARSVEERFDLVAALAEGAPVTRLDQTDCQALWRAVGDVTLLAAPRERAIWRVSVPPTAGPEVLAAVPEASGYLDWAGGLIWLATEPEGDAGAAKLKALIAPHGGHATLVRAPDDLRARLDFAPDQPAPLLALAARVKDAFDPLGLFNPGRLYRDV